MKMVCLISKCRLATSPPSTFTRVTCSLRETDVARGTEIHHVAEIMLGGGGG